MSIGRLLFPAIRWRDEAGFFHERERIAAALDMGVGGFIVFGGAAREVSALTADLQRRSAHPLLIGADVERGAGQQFDGATRLPPLAAIGRLDDEDVTRRAGELTARESLALGVNWVYAPMADLDVEPRNPIVGTRSFGSDPGMVGRHVAAWVRGCAEAGALSCAKHFPGHGRTTADSHVELPRVDADREALDQDLAPFRAALAAGVDSLMTAHVVYDALDPEARPATLSPPILEGLLRGELGFDGMVVSDALIMEGVLEGAGGEGEAAVRALAAGCDALLYPDHLETVAEALERALGRGVGEERVAEALRRIADAAERVPAAPAGAYGEEEDRRWALEIAERSLIAGKDGGALQPRPASEPPVTLITIDDDLGGPYPPPSRERLPEALRAGGVEVRLSPEGDPPRGTERESPSATGGAVLLALYADIRAWKGSPAISERARERVARIRESHPEAALVLFGHPRLAREVPGGCDLVAWGGEPLMQEAAARRLAGG